jgi:hypothetical protein
MAFEDYPNPTAYQFQGASINVIGLVKKMMEAKKNGETVTAGFGLEIYKDASSGEENYRCFFGSLCNRQRPSLLLDYYICDKKGGPFVDENNIRRNASCLTPNGEVEQCYSKFSKLRTINPYVEGIWGNWRADTTFVYYDNRTESDPTTAVDLQTGGTIANYQTFWLTDPNGKWLSRNNADAARKVWVWNSTVTQYNRKGYDIENKDPLGRFNAGLYGYNQQLPVAVVNNSRYRESMFDGFEDYGYQSNSCNADCNPPRHATFTDVAKSLDFTQKHTGKASARVSPGTSIALTSPVVSQANADKGYNIRVRVDSVIKQDTIIVKKGTGLTARYYNHGGYGQNPTILCPPEVNSTTLTTNPSPAFQIVERPWVNCPNLQGPNYGHPNYYSAINDQYYSVKWRGKLVPQRSAMYRFKAGHDNGFRIKINGGGFSGYITDNASTYGGNCGSPTGGTVVGPHFSSLVEFKKGVVYDIEIDFYNAWGPGVFHLNWEMDGQETSIPIECFYPENTVFTSADILYPNTQCTRFDYAQVLDNALTDTFSLIQGKRMVISAWVKEGGNDCHCTTYTKPALKISFPGTTAAPVIAKPAGSIIEGWQRIEYDFIVPSNATEIKVEMDNSSGFTNAYFDDVRIHPFNANMKSFVYHDSNLRLLSELDENNYATYYEYDDDGTLVRLKKETERGIKTIKETRSALQKRIQ